MMSTAVRQDIVRLIGAILIIALIGTIFASQPASAQAREANPGDFFLWEFAGGLAGSFAGAVAAAWGIQRFSKPESGEEGATATEHEITVDIVGLGAGSAVGATIGVVLTGSFLGVNGNLLFAPLGGVLGVINAFGLIYWMEIEQGQRLGPVVETIMVTAIPAFGVVTGYNIGAKMAGRSEKQETTATENTGPSDEGEGEFTLPLFELRF